MPRKKNVVWFGPQYRGPGQNAPVTKMSQPEASQPKVSPGLAVKEKKEIYPEDARRIRDLYIDSTLLHVHLDYERIHNLFFCESKNCKTCGARRYKNDRFFRPISKVPGFSDDCLVCIEERTVLKKAHYTTTEILEYFIKCFKRKPTLPAERLEEIFNYDTKHNCIPRGTKYCLCQHCGGKRPYTETYFHETRKDNTSTLSRVCKACPMDRQFSYTKRSR